MHSINIKAPLHNHLQRHQNPTTHHLIPTNVRHHHTFVRRKLIHKKTITININTISRDRKIFQVNLNKVQDSIQTGEKLSTLDRRVEDCSRIGERDYGKLKEGGSIAKGY